MHLIAGLVTSFLVSGPCHNTALRFSNAVQHTTGHTSFAVHNTSLHLSYSDQSTTAHASKSRQGLPSLYSKTPPIQSRTIHHSAPKQLSSRHFSYPNQSHAQVTPRIHVRAQPFTSRYSFRCTADRYSVPRSHHYFPRDSILRSPFLVSNSCTACQYTSRFRSFPQQTKPRFQARSPQIIPQLEFTASPQLNTPRILIFCFRFSARLV